MHEDIANSEKINARLLNHKKTSRKYNKMKIKQIGQNISPIFLESNSLLLKLNVCEKLRLLIILKLTYSRFYRMVQ